LNKEKPLYDESKWFRKWNNKEFIKCVNKQLNGFRILENLIGTGSSPSDDIVYFAGHSASFKTYDSIGRWSFCDFRFK
jgi:hypothetical protein